VISAGHRDKVVGYIEKGVKEGAQLLVDGRTTRVEDRPNATSSGDGVRQRVGEDADRPRRDLGPVASIGRSRTLYERSR